MNQIILQWLQLLGNNLFLLLCIIIILILVISCSFIFLKMKKKIVVAMKDTKFEIEEGIYFAHSNEIIM